MKAKMIKPLFKLFQYKIHGKLKMKNQTNRANLHEISTDKTFSKISHLIGFGFVALITLISFIRTTIHLGLFF